MTRVVPSLAVIVTPRSTRTSYQRSSMQANLSSQGRVMLDALMVVPGDGRPNGRLPPPPPPPPHAGEGRRGGLWHVVELFAGCVGGVGLAIGAVAGVGPGPAAQGVVVV